MPLVIVIVADPLPLPEHEPLVVIATASDELAVAFLVHLGLADVEQESGGLVLDVGEGEATISARRRAEA